MESYKSLELYLESSSEMARKNLYGIVQGSFSAEIRYHPSLPHGGFPGMWRVSKEHAAVSRSGNVTR